VNADQLIAALSKFTGAEREIDVVLRDSENYVHEILDVTFNDGIEFLEEILPEHRPKVASTLVQLSVGDKLLGCSSCGGQDFTTDNPSQPGYTQFVCAACSTPVPERVA